MSSDNFPSSIDTDRLDADLENKGRIWINEADSQNGGSESAIRCHAALADFIDLVAEYIHAYGNEASTRHDIVVQAKATISFLEPRRNARSALIEAFYYGLVIRLLDEQYGNSMPKGEVDDEINKVRRQTQSLTEA